jgi:site-specific DNA recombinase
MKQTAALYARVSTQRQEEEATIASQVAAIEDYANSQGYALRKDLYFLDEAVSGAKLDRPALDRLRDQASEGSFQAVVCLSPDRLARVYTLQVLLLEEFRQAGIQMVFVNQPPVSDNPQNQLLFGIQGLFAEYERAVIAERMRRGRLHSARQGEMMNSQTPYGYCYVPQNGAAAGRWEINPVEAEVVRQIYVWYTQSKPMAMQEIANRLNQGQILPRNGQNWQTSLVGNILRQTQYTGLAYYNRTQKMYHEIGQLRQSGHGRRICAVSVPRPSAEWISMPVPSILEKDIWLMAQERLKTNQRFSARNNCQHRYLLRGLLVCAVCGHTLTGRTESGRMSYTCRYAGKLSPPDVPHHTCSIHGNTVESLVWGAVVELLQNPKLISQAWGCSEDTQPASAEPGEKERLENRLRALARQQERLLDLFQNEHLDKPTYLERKQRLQDEQQNLQARLLQFGQDAKSEQIKQQLIGDFDQYCQRIQANLVNPSPDLQQEVIRLLIDHVVVGINEIVIKHIVPTDDDRRLQPQRQTGKTDLWEIASAGKHRLAWSRSLHGNDMERL